jgi:hypothetical protein
MREDELDRCVSAFKLRAARERIREREGRCEVRRASGHTDGWFAAYSGRTGTSMGAKMFRPVRGLGARELQ